VPAKRKPTPGGHLLSNIRQTGTSVVCVHARAITALLPMAMLIRVLRGHNCVLLIYVWKNMGEKEKKKIKWRNVYAYLVVVTCNHFI
jgi:hypothetical protein